MSGIGNTTSAVMPLSVAMPMGLSRQGGALELKHPGSLDASDALPLNGKRNTKEEVQEKFTQFVGEAFYGQMFKAMRSTVGKPAYFHGGRAEEVFQGQLDQTMSEQLTKSTASKFAEPMFERQFPQYAAAADSANLEQLENLRRR
jgi:hypothetical protein